MEYQKVINLLDSSSNQPSKFRKKNRVEINDDRRGVYNVNSQIKFKTTMLKSSLCDYSDVYISVADTSAADAAANNTNNNVIFINCAPFTNCISEINNTQVDNTKDIDSSSIVIEVIRLILNLFYFFLRENFTSTKSIKMLNKQTKTKKATFLCS